MSSKYEPLRRALDARPGEEPVFLTFDELDQLVAGLPPSARVHPSWWGNTFSHNRPHALAWMVTGRRVVEVRMGEAVVFSPAHAATSGGARGRPTPRGRAATVLDGAEALAATLGAAGYASVPEAVAAHTVFLHPETVAQTRGVPLFRHVRDPVRRGTIGNLADGKPVMFDDNTGPRLAFLWAAQAAHGRDVQYNHVWSDPLNVETYTALWNLCVTPAFLAKTTDGSNHPEVVELLRYRAFDLFGRIPAGEDEPRRPRNYDSLTWPAPPEPVADLEAVLRRRLADSPKSRPALSARQIGWAFSSGPDGRLPQTARGLPL